MKITPSIINAYGKWRVGNDPFESAKTIVASLDNQSIPDEEKKRIAVEQLKVFGYALAGFLLNLAIEIAVDYLRSKLEK